MTDLTIGQVFALGAQEETRVPRSEAVPYGQDQIQPHDLAQRVISLEAEVAALQEQMARVLDRLLLPETPSEP